jgi:hypothetical protein
MILRLCLSLLCACALVLGASDGQAQQQKRKRPPLPKVAPEKPAVPPDRDPGGVLVALVAQGIDYRLPALSSKLARDGEGELVGGDVVDNDRLPFDATEGAAPPDLGGDASAIATRVLASGAPVRLAPIRVDAEDASSIARGVRLAGQIRARIVLLPLWSRDSARWHLFVTAASAQPSTLFVLPAAEGAKPEEAFPAAFALDNAIVVSSGAESADSPGFGGQMRALGPGPFALAITAARAARLLAAEPGMDVPRLKAALGKQP